MVSPIKWYNSDPDNAGRGKGMYYKRYGKKGIKSDRYGKRIHYAKYDSMQDYKRKSKTRIKKGNPNYPHVGDGTYRKSKKHKGLTSKYSNSKRV